MITDNDKATIPQKPLIGKIRHNDHYRIISLPETLDEFFDKWKEVTGDVLDKKNCIFTYIDDENDAIRISLEEEYPTALQIIRQFNEKNNVDSKIHMELQYNSKQKQTEKNETKLTTPTSYNSTLQKDLRAQNKSLLGKGPNLNTDKSYKWNLTKSPNTSNNNNNQPAISIDTNSNNNTTVHIKELAHNSNPNLNHPFFKIKGAEKKASVQRLKALKKSDNATEKLAQELVSMGLGDLEENKKLLIDNDNKFRKVVKILVGKDNQDKTVSLS